MSCELEFFVHGALCVCYSGQCYMSEAVAGRSANRGACIQACRSLYDLVDGSGKTIVKDKALLSLKDYNLLGRLSELAEDGIDSFKIEGRLKNISYVRNTVRAYSLALDELVSKHPDLYARASYGRSEGGFTPNLGKTFNRGYTELFLDGKRGKWSSMDAPKSVGQPVGTVVQIDAPQTPHRNPGSVSTIVLKLDNPALQIKNGDGFSFLSKDGKSIIGFRADVCRGSVIQSRNIPELFVGARLHRNLDTAFEKEIESNLPVRKIPVTVELSISTGIAGEPSGPGRVHPRFALRQSSGTAAAEYSLSPASAPAYHMIVEAKSQDGRMVHFDIEAGKEAASNKKRMEAMFTAQIGKDTGIYSFSLTSLDIRTSDGSIPIMSAAALNGIRREIAERLDRMPCGKVPMYNPYDTVAEPVEATEESGPKGPEVITYKSNVSNGIAERVYRRLGASAIEDAYELTHRKEAELMRSKYCIRHELGLCLKSHPAGDLYLVNNGRRYRLDFDCANCEMTVYKA